MVWRFYGYASESEYREAVRNPLQKVDTQDQEWISALLDRLTLNGESASYRRHCIKRDGEEAWINVVMGRIINSNGVEVIQAVFTDITEQMRLEQAQEQMDMIQAVLGGIGAVSLFVAAIGIANTMMMSIYERTREIGVLKVLGCALGDIRSMFLIEAGFIGLMGGAAGLLLSYGVSSLINKFLGSGLMGMGGGGGDISRIPIWLSAAAVGFAIVIGMLAGLFPALRAMRLSPLAAIRNE